MIGDEAKQDLFSYILTNNVASITQYFSEHPQHIDLPIGEHQENTLMLATRYGQHQVIEALLRLPEKPSLTATNQLGQTAEQIAISIGQQHLLALLKPKEIVTDSAIAEAVVKVREMPQQKPKSKAEQVAIQSILTDLRAAVRAYQASITSPQPTIINLLSQTIEQLVSHDGDYIDQNEAVLFDLILTVNGLLTVLQSSPQSEQAIKQALLQLINQRDGYIRGTGLDYCYYNGKVNRALSELIDGIWPESVLTVDDELPNNKFDILMQNYQRFEGLVSEVGCLMDQETWGDRSIPASLATFMRDRDGHIHLLYDLPNQDEVDLTASSMLANAFEVLESDADSHGAKLRKRSDLWLTHDTRNHGKPLPSQMVNWLIQQCSPLAEIDDYIHQKELEDNGSDCRKQIQQLAEGLAAGGKKSDDPNATETEAGDAAVTAIPVFAEWYNKLKEEQPQKWAALNQIEYIDCAAGQGNKRRTFGETVFPVLQPDAAEVQANKESKSLLCCDKNGASLHAFLKDARAAKALAKLDKITPVKIKTKSEILALKQRVIEALKGRQQSDFNHCSATLTGAYWPMNFNGLTWLAKLNERGSPIDFVTFKQLNSLLESPYGAELKLASNQAKRTATLEPLTDDCPVALLMQYLSGKMALEEKDLVDASPLQLKAYIIAQSAKTTEHGISQALLKASYLHACQKEPVDRSWIFFLLEQGLSAQTTIDFNDDRFPELKVGADISIEGRLVNYRVMERDGNKLRIRYPKTEITGRDADVQIHVSFDTDGKEDEFLDLKTDWQKIYIGKVDNGYRSPLQPKVRRCQSMMAYALFRGDYRLVETLVAEHNIDIAAEINSIADVVNTDPTLKGAKVLTALVNGINHRDDLSKPSSELLSQLFVLCRQTNQINLIVSLIELGLEVEYCYLSLNGNHGIHSNQSLMSYALDKDSRDLISALVKQGCLAKESELIDSRASWAFARAEKSLKPNIKIGALAYYFKKLSEYNMLEELPQQHQCVFSEVKQQLIKYADGHLPRDLSELLHNIQLFDLTFDLNHEKLSKNFLGVVTTQAQNAYQAEITKQWQMIVALFKKVSTLSKEQSERFKKSLAGLASKMVMAYGNQLQITYLDHYTFKVCQADFLSELFEAMIQSKAQLDFSDEHVQRLIMLALRVGVTDEVSALVSTQEQFDCLYDLVNSSAISQTSSAKLLIQLFDKHQFSSRITLCQDKLTTSFIKWLSLSRNTILQSPRDWTLLYKLLNAFDRHHLADLSVESAAQLSPFVHQAILLAISDYAVVDDIKTEKERVKAISLNQDLMAFIKYVQRDLNVDLSAIGPRQQSCLDVAIVNNKLDLVDYFIEKNMTIKPVVLLDGDQKSSSIEWSTVIKVFEHIKQQQGSLSAEQYYGLVIDALCHAKSADAKALLAIDVKLQQALSTAQALTFLQTVLARQPALFETVSSRLTTQLSNLTEVEKSKLLVQAIISDKVVTTQSLITDMALKALTVAEINALCQSQQNLIHYLQCARRSGQTIDPTILTQLAVRAFDTGCSSLLIELIRSGLDLSQPMGQHAEAASLLMNYALAIKAPALTAALLEQGVSPLPYLQQSANQTAALPNIKILLSASPEQQQKLSTLFVSAYNALYDTRAFLNVGIFSYFRAARRWRRDQQPNLDEIITYCQENPDSRSAQTLNALLKHAEVVVNPKQSEQALCDLFAELHQLSVDSSIFARTRITEKVADSLESIKAYTAEHQGSRSAEIAEALNIR